MVVARRRRAPCWPRFSHLAPRARSMAEDGDPFDTESTHISHKRDPFESFGLDARPSGKHANPNGRSSSQRGKHAPLAVVDDPSDDEGEVYFLRCTDRYPGWANAVHRRLAVATAFLIVGGAGLRLWQLRNADSAVLPHPSRLVHHRSRAPPLGTSPPPAPNALPSGVAWPSSSDEESGDYQFWRTPPSPPSRQPPPPPPSPPPLFSASAATAPSHETINARFRRDPYSSWSSVPSAGVLLHCLDGYEDHSQPWLPGTAAWSKSPLGSVPARRLCHLRARLASSGSLAFPGRGPVTGRPATDSGARGDRPPKPPIPPPLTIQAQTGRRSLPRSSSHRSAYPRRRTRSPRSAATTGGLSSGLG